VRGLQEFVAHARIWGRDRHAFATGTKLAHGIAIAKYSAGLNEKGPLGVFKFPWFALGSLVADGNKPKH
jgi:hypothetical protein